MTDPTRTPAQSLVVPVTLSAPAQRVASYVDARCPGCNRIVMAVPGPVIVEVRKVKDNAARSGRGRVTSCKRCSTLCEIVEHAA